MAKGIKKGKLGSLSFLISENPKKVIALIIAFTIIMGYFASSMSMETTEGSFSPESEKRDWLDRIREDFGTSGESVQMAFVADNEDVFTREVLLDMINTKIALRDDEVINSSLIQSGGMTDSVSTLADTIVYANLTLQIEDYVVNLPEKTNSTVSTFETQYRINQYMNSSLSSAMYLMSSSDSTVADYSTYALVSMSNIVSDPRSWSVTYMVQSDIANLTYALQYGTDQEVIQQLDMLYSKLDSPSITLAGMEPSHVEYFSNLFFFSKGIFETSSDPTELQTARGMLLSFLGMGSEMGGLDMDSMSMDLSEGLPSLSADLETKKEMIERMDDSEIKDTVLDILTYDPTDLNESVDEVLNDFGRMEASAQNSIDVLEDVNSTLSQAIHSLQAAGNDDSVSALIDYKTVVLTNKSMMEYSIQSFQETSTMIQSSRYISSQIYGLKDGITMSVSGDFSPTDERSSIRAESAIGMVLMNSSMDRDIRLEAQKGLIDISKQECEHSHPRVFAGQIMMEEINESADKSLNLLLPIAFAFVVLVLFLVYRTLIETAVSLLALGFAIVWTFGAGVLLGYEFNPMIIAVPILITGLVIDYGIHMVMRHREERKEGYGPGESTRIAISTVGGALFLTTFTTVIGFLSNTFSSMEAMQHFGILAAIGISSSFVLMVAGLPAVLQLVEERRERKGDKRVNKKIDKLTKKGGKDILGSILSVPVDTSDKHPFIVILVVILITGTSLYGVFSISTTFDMEDFLPEDKPQSKNIRYISNHYNISTSYSYILTEGDLDTRGYLYAVHETMENIRDDEMIANSGSDTMSVLSVLQSYGTATPGSPYYNITVVDAFDASDTDGDNIPDENIGQLYDLFYESDTTKDSMKSVLSREGSEYTSAIIKVKEDAAKITRDMNNAEILKKELEEDSENLEEDGFEVKITGSSMISQQTIEELNNTQIKGLITTIFIVLLVLTIVFYAVHKSLILGLITTLPVAIITLWIVGTMYMVGVSLNVMTVSITALTVGMGVDYSIHITHRFTEELHNGNNVYESMHETIHNTGAALFGSAMTTVGAFAILGTSEILPMSQFGYITALAITYSFLVAVFVLPSGLAIWAKYKDTKKRKRKM